MTTRQQLQTLVDHPAVRDYWNVGDQLRAHVDGRSLAAFARGDAARDAVCSRAALRRRQRAARRCFLRGLGGLPAASTPLNARTVGVVPGRGGTVENVIFESRPQTFVSANLYLPARLAGPRGAVLLLCGHDPTAKLAYQGVAWLLVQAGLIVLVQDPIGQGERLSYSAAEYRAAGIRWGTAEHDYAGAQCLPLGDALARYFLHDAMRGIDYLQSRPEVDRQRVGVTGASGGGTQTTMMMLADPRLAAAAPAIFLTNRASYLGTGQAQDAEQIWPGFTAAGFDHEDILLAMCPRPVRVLAVQSDFFPIEGTRRTVARCRRFWRLAGQPGHLDLVEDASIHSYTPRLAAAAAEFFARHLLGARHRVVAPVQLLPSAQLACTRSGQMRDDRPEARAVYHENRARLRELAATRRPSRRAALAWLRRQVVAQRQAGELNPRFMTPGRCGGLAVTQSFWWSQPGLLNHGLLFHATGPVGRRWPVTLAVWDGGTTAVPAHWPWIRRQCRLGRAVLVLDVTGVGAIRPHPLNSYPPLEFYGVMHKLADDLLWLGDDLVALRTYDVLRAVDVVGQWPGLAAERIACYAHGRQGVYAQLAAALDRRVRALQVVGGLGSYAAFVGARQYATHDIKSILCRGILPHLDLPELRRWQRADRRV